MRIGWDRRPQESAQDHRHRDEQQSPIQNRLFTSDLVTHRQLRPAVPGLPEQFRHVPRGREDQHRRAQHRDHGDRALRPRRSRDTVIDHALHHVGHREHSCTSLGGHHAESIGSYVRGDPPRDRAVTSLTAWPRTAQTSSPSAKSTTGQRIQGCQLYRRLSRYQPDRPFATARDAPRRSSPRTTCAASAGRRSGPSRPPRRAARPDR